mgnify:CR=1 FL=1
MDTLTIGISPATVDPLNTIINYYNWGVLGGFLVMFFFVLIVMQGIKTLFSEIEDLPDPRNQTNFIKVVTCRITKRQIQIVALFVTVVCIAIIRFALDYSWWTWMAAVEILVSISLITYIYNISGGKLLQSAIVWVFSRIPFIKVDENFLKTYTKEEYIKLAGTVKIN